MNNRRYHPVIRTIAAAVAVSFFAQDLSFASIDLNQKNEIRPKTFSLPQNIGIIKEATALQNPEVIINIKDMHDNFSAQESITHILENLVANYSVKTIGIEGSSGYVDTSILASLPYEDMKRNTANFLMKEGRLSAGEFFSAMNDEKITVYGMDDQKLYRENLEAFKNCLKNKKDYFARVAKLKNALENMEGVVYSGELEELERNGILVNNGTLKFSERWKTISSMADKYHVAYMDHPNIKSLLFSITAEKQIDFKVAGSQRESLMDVLGKKLPKEKLEKLIEESISYKLGRISQGSFSSYLLNAAREEQMAMDGYTELQKYADYMLVYESLDIDALKEEIWQVEEKIRSKVYRNDDERLLHGLLNDVSILSDLLELKLSSESLRYFKAHRDEFVPERFRVFLNKGASQYGLAEADVDLDAIFKAVPDMMSFYEAAEKRNEALLANTVKKMRESGQRVACLVTGGFHSRGITELLKNRQMSYIVILPRYDKKSTRPYLTVVTNQSASYKEFAESEQVLDTKLRMTAHFFAQVAYHSIEKKGTSTDAEKTATIQKEVDRAKTLYLENFQSRQKTAAAHFVSSGGQAAAGSKPETLADAAGAGSDKLAPLSQMLGDVETKTMQVIFSEGSVLIYFETSRGERLLTASLKEGQVAFDSQMLENDAAKKEFEAKLDLFQKGGLKPAQSGDLAAKEKIERLARIKGLAPASVRIGIAGADIIGRSSDTEKFSTIEEHDGLNNHIRDVLKLVVDDIEASGVSATQVPTSDTGTVKEFKLKQFMKDLALGANVTESKAMVAGVEITLKVLTLNGGQTVLIYNPEGQGELTVVDSRFGSDHYGYGVNAAYASTIEIAAHELIELKIWAEVLKKQGISPEEARAQIRGNIGIYKVLADKVHAVAANRFGYKEETSGIYKGNLDHSIIDAKTLYESVGRAMNDADKDRQAISDILAEVEAKRGPPGEAGKKIMDAEVSRILGLNEAALTLELSRADRKLIEGKNLFYYINEILAEVMRRMPADDARMLLFDKAIEKFADGIIADSAQFSDSDKSAILRDLRNLVRFEFGRDALAENIQTKARPFVQASEKIKLLGNEAETAVFYKDFFLAVGLSLRRWSRERLKASLGISDTDEATRNFRENFLDWFPELAANKNTLFDELGKTQVRFEESFDLGIMPVLVLTREQWSKMGSFKQGSAQMAGIHDTATAVAFRSNSPIILIREDQYGGNLERIASPGNSFLEMLKHEEGHHNYRGYGYGDDEQWIDEIWATTRGLVLGRFDGHGRSDLNALLQADLAVKASSEKEFADWLAGKIIQRVLKQDFYKKFLGGLDQAREAKLDALIRQISKIIAAVAEKNGYGYATALDGIFDAISRDQGRITGTAVTLDTLIQRLQMEELQIVREAAGVSAKDRQSQIQQELIRLRQNQQKRQAKAQQTLDLRIAGVADEAEKSRQEAWALIVSGEKEKLKEAVGKFRDVAAKFKSAADQGDGTSRPKAARCEAVANMLSLMNDGSLFRGEGFINSRNDLADFTKELDEIAAKYLKEKGDDDFLRRLDYLRYALLNAAEAFASGMDAAKIKDSLETAKRAMSVVTSRLTANREELARLTLEIDRLNSITQKSADDLKALKKNEIEKSLIIDDLGKWDHNRLKTDERIRTYQADLVAAEKKTDSLAVSSAVNAALDELKDAFTCLTNKSRAPPVLAENKVLAGALEGGESQVKSNQQESKEGKELAVAGVDGSKDFDGEEENGTPQTPEDIRQVENQAAVQNVLHAVEIKFQIEEITRFLDQALQALPSDLSARELVNAPQLRSSASFVEAARKFYQKKDSDTVEDAELLALASLLRGIQAGDQNALSQTAASSPIFAPYRKTFDPQRVEAPADIVMAILNYLKQDGVFVDKAGRALSAQVVASRLLIYEGWRLIQKMEASTDEGPKNTFKSWLKKYYGIRADIDIDARMSVYIDFIKTEKANTRWADATEEIGVLADANKANFTKIGDKTYDGRVLDLESEVLSEVFLSQENEKLFAVPRNEVFERVFEDSAKEDLLKALGDPGTEIGKLKSDFADTYPEVFQDVTLKKILALDTRGNKDLEHIKSVFLSYKEKENILKALEDSGTELGKLKSNFAGTYPNVFQDVTLQKILALDSQSNKDFKYIKGIFLRYIWNRTIDNMPKENRVAAVQRVTEALHRQMLKIRQAFKQTPGAAAENAAACLVFAESVFELTCADSRGMTTPQRIMLSLFMQGKSAGLLAGGGKTPIYPMFQGIKRMMMGKEWSGVLFAENDGGVGNFMAGPWGHGTYNQIAQAFGITLVNGNRAHKDNMLHRMSLAFKSSNEMVVMDFTTAGHVHNLAHKYSDRDQRELYHALEGRKNKRVGTIDEMHIIAVSRMAAVLGEAARDFTRKEGELTADIVSKIYDSEKNQFRYDVIITHAKSKALTFDKETGKVTGGGYDELVNYFKKGGIGEGQKVIIISTESTEPEPFITESLSNELSELKSAAGGGAVLRSVILGLSAGKDKYLDVDDPNNPGKLVIAPQGGGEAQATSVMQDTYYQAAIAFRIVAQKYMGKFDSKDLKDEDRAFRDMLIDEAVDMVRLSESSISVAVTDGISFYARNSVGATGTIDGLENLGQTHIGAAIVNINASQLNFESDTFLNLGSSIDILQKKMKVIELGRSGDPQGVSAGQSGFLTVEDSEKLESLKTRLNSENEADRREARFDLLFFQALVNANTMYAQDDGSAYIRSTLLASSDQDTRNRLMQKLSSYGIATPLLDARVVNDDPNAVGREVDDAGKNQTLIDAQLVLNELKRKEAVYEKFEKLKTQIAELVRLEENDIELMKEFKSATEEYLKIFGKKNTPHIETAGVAQQSVSASAGSLSFSAGQALTQSEFDAMTADISALAPGTTLDQVKQSVLEADAKVKKIIAAQIEIITRQYEVQQAAEEFLRLGGDRTNLDAAIRRLQQAREKPENENALGKKGVYIYGKTLVIAEFGETGRDYKTLDGLGRKDKDGKDFLNGMNEIIDEEKAERTKKRFSQLRRRVQRQTILGDRFIVANNEVLDERLSDLEIKTFRDDVIVRWGLVLDNPQEWYDSMQKDMTPYLERLKATGAVDFERKKEIHEILKKIYQNKPLAINEKVIINAWFLDSREVSESVRFSMQDTIRNRTVDDLFKLLSFEPELTPEQEQSRQRAYKNAKNDRSAEADLIARRQDLTNEELYAYAHQLAALVTAEKAWIQLLCSKGFLLPGIKRLKKEDGKDETDEELVDRQMKEGDKGKNDAHRKAESILRQIRQAKADLDVWQEKAKKYSARLAQERRQVKLLGEEAALRQEQLEKLLAGDTTDQSLETARAARDEAQTAFDEARARLKKTLEEQATDFRQARDRKAVETAAGENKGDVYQMLENTFFVAIQMGEDIIHTGRAQGGVFADTKTEFVVWNEQKKANKSLNAHIRIGKEGGMMVDIFDQADGVKMMSTIAWVEEDGIRFEQQDEAGKMRRFFIKLDNIGSRIKVGTILKGEFGVGRQVKSGRSVSLSPICAEINSDTDLMTAVHMLPYMTPQALTEILHSIKGSPVDTSVSLGKVAQSMGMKWDDFFPDLKERIRVYHKVVAAAIGWDANDPPAGLTETEYKMALSFAKAFNPLMGAADNPQDDRDSAQKEWEATEKIYRICQRDLLTAEAAVRLAPDDQQKADTARQARNKLQKATAAHAANQMKKRILELSRSNQLAALDQDLKKLQPLLTAPEDAELLKPLLKTDPAGGVISVLEETSTDLQGEALLKYLAEKKFIKKGQSIATLREAALAEYPNFEDQPMAAMLKFWAGDNKAGGNKQKIQFLIYPEDQEIMIILHRFYDVLNHPDLSLVSGGATESKMKSAAQALAKMPEVSKWGELSADQKNQLMLAAFESQNMLKGGLNADRALLLFDQSQRLQSSLLEQARHMRDELKRRAPSLAMAPLISQVLTHHNADENFPTDQAALLTDLKAAGLAKHASLEAPISSDPTERAPHFLTETANESLQFTVDLKDAEKTAANFELQSDTHLQKAIAAGLPPQEAYRELGLARDGYRDAAIYYLDPDKKRNNLNKFIDVSSQMVKNELEMIRKKTAAAGASGAELWLDLQPHFTNLGVDARLVFEMSAQTAGPFADGMIGVTVTDLLEAARLAFGAGNFILTRQIVNLLQSARSDISAGDLISMTGVTGVDPLLSVDDNLSHLAAKQAQDIAEQSESMLLTGSSKAADVDKKNVDRKGDALQARDMLLPFVSFFEAADPVAPKLLSIYRKAAHRTMGQNAVIQGSALSRVLRRQASALKADELNKEETKWLLSEATTSRSSAYWLADDLDELLGLPESGQDRAKFFITTIFADLQRMKQDRTISNDDRRRALAAACLVWGSGSPVIESIQKFLSVNPLSRKEAETVIEQTQNVLNQSMGEDKSLVVRGGVTFKGEVYMHAFRSGREQWTGVGTGDPVDRKPEDELKEAHEKPRKVLTLTQVDLLEDNGANVAQAEGDGTMVLFRNRIGSWTEDNIFPRVNGEEEAFLNLVQADLGRMSRGEEPQFIYLKQDGSLAFARPAYAMNLFPKALQNLDSINREFDSKYQSGDRRRLNAEDRERRDGRKSDREFILEKMLEITSIKAANSRVLSELFRRDGMTSEMTNGQIVDQVLQGFFQHELQHLVDRQNGYERFWRQSRGGDFDKYTRISEITSHLRSVFRSNTPNIFLAQILTYVLFQTSGDGYTKAGQDILAGLVKEYEKINVNLLNGLKDQGKARQELEAEIPDPDNPVWCQIVTNILGHEAGSPGTFKRMAFVFFERFLAEQGKEKDEWEEKNRIKKETDDSKKIKNPPAPVPGKKDPDIFSPPPPPPPDEMAKLSALLLTPEGRDRIRQLLSSAIGNALEVPGVFKNPVNRSILEKALKDADFDAFKSLGPRPSDAQGLKELKNALKSSSGIEVQWRGQRFHRWVLEREAEKLELTLRADQIYGELQKVLSETAAGDTQTYGQKLNDAYTKLKLSAMSGGSGLPPGFPPDPDTWVRHQAFPFAFMTQWQQNIDDSKDEFRSAIDSLLFLSDHLDDAAVSGRDAEFSELVKKMDLKMSQNFGAALDEAKVSGARLVVPWEEAGPRSLAGSAFKLKKRPAGIDEQVWNKHIESARKGLGLIFVSGDQSKPDAWTDLALGAVAINSVNPRAENNVWAAAELGGSAVRSRILERAKPKENADEKKNPAAKAIEGVESARIKGGFPRARMFAAVLGDHGDLAADSVQEPYSFDALGNKAKVSIDSEWVYWDAEVQKNIEETDGRTNGRMKKLIKVIGYDAYRRRVGWRLAVSKYRQNLGKDEIDRRLKNDLKDVERFLDILWEQAGSDETRFEELLKSMKTDKQSVAIQTLVSEVDAEKKADTERLKELTGEDIFPGGYLSITNRTLFVPEEIFRKVQRYRSADGVFLDILDAILMPKPADDKFSPEKMKKGVSHEANHLSHIGFMDLEKDEASNEITRQFHEGRKQGYYTSWVRKLQKWKAGRRATNEDIEIARAYGDESVFTEKPEEKGLANLHRHVRRIADPENKVTDVSGRVEIRYGNKVLTYAQWSEVIAKPEARSAGAARMRFEVRELPANAPGKVRIIVVRPVAGKEMFDALLAGIDKSEKLEQENKWLDSAAAIADELKTEALYLDPSAPGADQRWREILEKAAVLAANVRQSGIDPRHDMIGKIAGELTEALELLAAGKKDSYPVPASLQNSQADLPLLVSVMEGIMQLTGFQEIKDLRTKFLSIINHYETSAEFAQKSAVGQSEPLKAALADARKKLKEYPAHLDLAERMYLDQEDFGKGEFFKTYQIAPQKSGASGQQSAADFVLNGILRAGNRLVFSFRSIKDQTKTLGRIRLFVEEDSKGKVTDWKEADRRLSASPVAGHDYDMADIADFLNKVPQDSLNKWESLFVKSLLKGGLLVLEAGTYKAAENTAVLSASLDSIEKDGFAYFRDTVDHEVKGHGRYFSDKDFRDEVERVWEKLLREEERAVILQLFREMKYKVSTVKGDPGYRLLLTELHAFGRDSRAFLQDINRLEVMQSLERYPNLLRKLETIFGLLEMDKDKLPGQLKTGLLTERLRGVSIEGLGKVLSRINPSDPPQMTLLGASEPLPDSAVTAGEKEQDQKAYDSRKNRKSVHDLLTELGATDVKRELIEEAITDPKTGTQRAEPEQISNLTKLLNDLKVKTSPEAAGLGIPQSLIDEAFLREGGHGSVQAILTHMANQSAGRQNQTPASSLPPGNPPTSGSRPLPQPVPHPQSSESPEVALYHGSLSEDDTVQGLVAMFKDDRDKIIKYFEQYYEKGPARFLMADTVRALQRQFGGETSKIHISVVVETVKDMERLKPEIRDIVKNVKEKSQADYLERMMLADNLIEIRREGDNTYIAFSAAPNSTIARLVTLLKGNRDDIAAAFGLFEKDKPLCLVLADAAILLSGNKDTAVFGPGVLRMVAQRKAEDKKSAGDTSLLTAAVITAGFKDTALSAMMIELLFKTNLLIEEVDPADANKKKIALDPAKNLSDLLRILKAAASGGFGSLENKLTIFFKIYENGRGLETLMAQTVLALPADICSALTPIEFMQLIQSAKTDGKNAGALAQEISEYLASGKNTVNSIDKDSLQKLIGAKVLIVTENGARYENNATIAMMMAALGNDKKKFADFFEAALDDKILGTLIADVASAILADTPDSDVHPGVLRAVVSDVAAKTEPDKRSIQKIKELVVRQQQYENHVNEVVGKMRPMLITGGIISPTDDRRAELRPEATVSQFLAAVGTDDANIADALLIFGFNPAEGLFLAGLLKRISDPAALLSRVFSIAEDAKHSGRPLQSNDPTTLLEMINSNQPSSNSAAPPTLLEPKETLTHILATAGKDAGALFSYYEAKFPKSPGSQAPDAGLVQAMADLTLALSNAADSDPASPEARLLDMLNAEDLVYYPWNYYVPGAVFDVKAVIQTIKKDVFGSSTQAARLAIAPAASTALTPIIVGIVDASQADLRFLSSKDFGIAAVFYSVSSKDISYAGKEAGSEDYLKNLRAQAGNQSRQAETVIDPRKASGGLDEIVSGALADAKDLIFLNRIKSLFGVLGTENLAETRKLWEQTSELINKETLEPADVLSVLNDVFGGKQETFPGNGSVRVFRGIQASETGELPVPRAMVLEEAMIAKINSSPQKDIFWKIMARAQEKGARLSVIGNSAAGIDERVHYEIYRDRKTAVAILTQGGVSKENISFAFGAEAQDTPEAVSKRITVENIASCKVMIVGEEGYKDPVLFFASFFIGENVGFGFKDETLLKGIGARLGMTIRWLRSLDIDRALRVAARLARALAQSA